MILEFFWDSLGHPLLGHPLSPLVLGMKGVLRSFISDMNWSEYAFINKRQSSPYKSVL
jgi:hypothetical protein